MNKTVLFSSVLGVVFISAAVFFALFQFKSFNTQRTSDAQAVVVKDGVQYITIQARGGYTPGAVNVAPGLPTKLVVKTAGTFDCSASLVIRSIGFQKLLQPTGEEVIDVGILKSGDTIQATCSMGMYGFRIHAS